MEPDRSTWFERLMRVLDEYDDDIYGERDAVLAWLDEYIHLPPKEPE